MANMTENDILRLTFKTILSYLGFFSSYLITGIFIIFIGTFLGFSFPESLTVLMPAGMVVMIIMLVRLTKKRPDLNVNWFYYSHLVFTFIVLGIGVIIEKTYGFTSQNEFVTDSGDHHIVISNSLSGDIYTILSQAFIFGSLILLVNAIRIKKAIPILSAFGSILILTGFLILTV